MSDTTVDARGQLCPKPLIMTKDALSAVSVGEQLSILIDNEISKENVCRFLEDHNAEVQCSEADGVFTILAKKLGEGPTPQSDTSSPTPTATGHVIVLKSETMGIGSEELGGILMKAFVNTLLQSCPMPSAIVMYNGGIHLAVEGSPLTESLAELESCGVRILVCGTCLDYYDKKDQLRAGVVSNMYEILEAMRTTSNVIVP